MQCLVIDPKQLIETQVRKFSFLHQCVAEAGIVNDCPIEQISLHHALNGYSFWRSEHPGTENDPKIVLRALRKSIDQLKKAVSLVMSAVVSAEFKRQHQFIAAFELIGRELPQTPIILFGMPTKGKIAFAYQTELSAISNFASVDVRQPDFQIACDECIGAFQSLLKEVGAVNSELQNKYLWAEKYLDDKRRVRYTIWGFFLSVLTLIIIDILLPYLVPHMAEAWNFILGSLQAFIEFFGFLIRFIIKLLS
ncbi:hypothetical protein HJA_10840 [Hyphomonas jannaschiana VP2]|uniref:Uncharacterized protein n=1 Tax=Hyphomonas jannaschiana VP2 TaxID=1280952 RepID=A0A059FC41_9PROT|nr:hypothetical protein HJA_10840 [Hyphomonas jannaschiana VP2]